MRALGISVMHLLAGSEDRLGVRQIIGARGLSNRLCDVQVQHYAHDGGAALTRNVVMIMNPACARPLGQGRSGVRRRFLESIRTANIPCIFMPLSGRIAASLDRDIERIGIPRIISRNDDVLLESRLKGVLREKIERRVRMHGVLLKMFGLGVMIHGDSGAGKTTLGMELVRRGHTWIADDMVEIEERQGRQLFARGVDAIRRYIDLKDAGIHYAGHIFPEDQIAEETKLDLILEIGAREERSCAQKDDSLNPFVQILGRSIPCVHLPEVRNRDFDLPELEQRVWAFDGQREASCRILEW